MPKCEKCCGENDGCGCTDPCKCDMEKGICVCPNCTRKKCVCHEQSGEGRKKTSASGEEKTGGGEGSHEGH
uniref:Metallothionein n=1 Tax=Plectus sambesii TaxID=2011161 RepID=A0A914VN04_9BILA